MKKPDGTHIVGIDLGTTYSLVADMTDAGPVILRNHLDESLTPSAVSVDESATVLVGASARARASRHPRTSALSFKRDMGTGQVYSLGAQRFTPVELSALVLLQLKRDAEAALGGPVSEAVVTVPAYFGDAQRQATRAAAKLAGLTVERIINEPTAAALAYGFHERAGTSRIAVLDLGGGTFDVTVLQVLDGVIEVSASSGDVRLGGDDFTRALVEAVAQPRSIDLSTPENVAALTDACEAVKRALTIHDEASALARLPSGDLSVSFSRAEAEQCWRALLERMRGPVERALADAKISSNDVDQVLLVGGSTRIPSVVVFARTLFGREPSVRLPQDEAVALGAAVQAALKVGHQSVDDIVATDIAPFSLGIAAMTQLRRSKLAGVFVPILERGTVLPASRVEGFATLGPEQSMVRIEVYQGEHAMVSSNTRLGELLVERLPTGRINHFDVRFTYDLNGILEVEVSLESGEKKVLVINRTGDALGASDLEAMRERFKALKIHPRETLPNRSALEMGETLYAQLLGEEREVLASLLAAFRIELNRGRRGDIEGARVVLLEFIRAQKGARTLLH